jgi:hypothetical protein
MFVSFRMIGCSLAFVLLYSPLARSAQTDDDIAKAIRDLGDESFSVRKQASSTLLNAGKRAKPALRLARKSSDPEVARRVRNLLVKLRVQPTADMPRGIAELIEKFYEAGPRDKENARILARLLSEGPKWYPLALELLDDAEDDRVRRDFFSMFGRNSGNFAAFLIAEGKTAEAEELLAARLARVIQGSERDDSELNVAVHAASAVAALGGTLDRRIAEFKQRVATGKNDQEAIALAHYYRAKGDLRNARKSAETARDLALAHQKKDDHILRMERGLVRRLLLQQEDWHALAAIPMDNYDAAERWAKVSYLGL